jgi:type II secretory pathway component PulF
MPIIFDELTKYAPDPVLERGLKVVAKDIREGGTLAQALGKHARLFDDANVELIAFAEQAGTLDAVLKTLIEHLDEMKRLRWRAVFMSLWPLYLALSFVFVGPLLTASQHLTSTSSVAALYFSALVKNLLLVAAIGAFIFAVPFLICALNAELAWDRFKRRAPVVSNAVRDLYASRLMLGLGLGVGSGLEVIRTLKVAAMATNSPSLIDGLPTAEALIRRGGTLADAIESFGLLDRSTLGTLAIAERTGTVSETLTKLSKDLQESSLRAIRILLLVVLALAAGVLLIGIVSSVLGTILGPIKTIYDAAGSGSLDQ